jgi:hypothetical protein
VNGKVAARVTLDANGQGRLRRSRRSTGPFTIRAVSSGDAHSAASSQSRSVQVN